jgi:hypothetical protein
VGFDGGGEGSNPDAEPDVTGVPDAPNSVCAAATGCRFAGAGAGVGAGNAAAAGAAGRRVTALRGGDTTS